MAFFYFDFDRTLRLKTAPFQQLIQTYANKPHLSTIRTAPKVVGIIQTELPLDKNTVKSILDQSVRLDDFTLQTNSIAVPQELTTVMSIHPPDSEFVREANKNTVVLYFRNGQVYDYDFVETTLERLEKSE